MHIQLFHSTIILLATLSSSLAIPTHNTPTPSQIIASFGHNLRARDATWSALSDGNSTAIDPCPKGNNACYNDNYYSCAKDCPCTRGNCPAACYIGCIERAEKLCGC